MNKAEKPDMDSVNLQQPSEKPFASTIIGPNDEDSGSDVSASPSDVENSFNTVRQSPAGPDHRSASTPDSKPPLQPESLGAIKQRLAELEAVDDVLVTRRNKLTAKRERKDERIRKRLAAEDARVKRQRDEEDARRTQYRRAKEERIRKRREIEDAEYRQKEKAHDDEEDELRRKLKNLKRGRPVDDEVTETRRASTVSESMSPPAKKHQPNPAPVQALNSPSRPNAMQPLQSPQQDQQPKAQYPYYYSWHPPPPIAGPYTYGPGETYPPQNPPHPPQHNHLQSSPLPNGGRLPFNPPAPPPRHGPSPKPTTPLSHAQSPRHQAPAPAPPPPPPPPPPPGPSHYDVRPPPATSSFTSINAPPSGFQSVNQPPAQTIRTPIQPASKTKRGHQSSAKAQALALEAGTDHSPSHPPISSPPASTPTLGGKRKASTTHPYSQSEAFANRHHHCERTDELDRGIWTYFGPGGTKEAPTVAGKKEMYLRCNHDDCMRIDWKTVHGLQCHIVKNHGIPKGTIGSLELALERYGVPVQDIEDHEKKHGLGSAGTMAEKGTRGRPRASRPSDEIVAPRATGAASGPVAGPPTAPPKPPSAARPKPSAPIVLFPNLAARSPSGGYVQDDIVYSEEESDGDESSVEVKQSIPRHITATTQWKASDSELSTPTTSKVEGDDGFRLPVPRSAPIEHGNPHTIDGLKSPEPRPTSGTETLAVTDTAPIAAESLPAPSTKLPLHSVAPATPIETETHGIVSAAEPVNGRLDTQDPDLVGTATTTESEVPSQTQNQTQTQTQNQTTQATSDAQDTTIPSTKSTSRPRGGERERRVPASERWDWAPIEDDDNATVTNASTSTTTTLSKRKNSTASGNTLTKAQQELQGIDGSVGGGDGDGEDGVAGGEDGSVNGNGNGTGGVTSKSPATARYSARKKTRRRVDA